VKVTIAFQLNAVPQTRPNSTPPAQSCGRPDLSTLVEPVSKDKARRGVSGVVANRRKERFSVHRIAFRTEPYRLVPNESPHRPGRDTI
jgi:hypothetical protein